MLAEPVRRASLCLVIARNGDRLSPSVPARTGPTFYIYIISNSLLPATTHDNSADEYRRFVFRTIY